MLVGFNLDKFLERSQALDLSDIDWELARSQPVTDAEVRCLSYMIDTEMYTIAYLRDLLNTTAIRDKEIADFLPCWAYEESYHGRALERVLTEAGRGLEHTRPRSFQRPKRLTEGLKDIGAAVISWFSDDFIAAYMTWGAINEMTALNGYKHVARKSQNPVLAEVCKRIMHDESRHFSFYYAKAQERLTDAPKAQKLTTFLLKKFWAPVGSGVCPESEVQHLSAYVFGDEEGRAAARQTDATIGRLPGLDWFNLVEKNTQGK